MIPSSHSSLSNIEVKVTVLMGASAARGAQAEHKRSKELNWAATLGT
jgi:hypothetical protein